MMFLTLHFRYDDLVVEEVVKDELSAEEMKERAKHEAEAAQRKREEELSSLEVRVECLYNEIEAIPF